MFWIWLSLAGLFLVIFVWYLWKLAVRVDRLHLTVLRSRNTLVSLLARRALTARDLALGGILDPASALLLDEAASKVLHAGTEIVDDGLGNDVIEATMDLAGNSEESRAVLESQLTQVIQKVLDEDTRLWIKSNEVHNDLLDSLDVACYRVTLARQFHNEHVSETLAIRRRLLVRIFRLAGRAAFPHIFEMDDYIGMEQR